MKYVMVILSILLFFVYLGNANADSIGSIYATEISSDSSQTSLDSPQTLSDSSQMPLYISMKKETREECKQRCENQYSSCKNICRQRPQYQNLCFGQCKMQYVTCTGSCDDL
jgi:hypothetical protein